MTNPGNQGWRSGAAPKGDKKKKRDWRSDTVSKGSRIRWGRLLKFGVGFGAIVALIVAIILLFFPADKTTVSVVVLGPQQYDSLDVPLAELTSAQLAKDWMGQTEVQVYSELKSEGFSVPQLTDSRAIVYVRAAAISTPEGVLLCDSGVTPAMVETKDAARGTLLDTLIDDLCEQKKPKLVLLDISPVREHWRMGSFAVDFMSELRAKQEKAANSNTVFFTAADVGERSWRSRSFGGQSVFRYFVQRGLRGDATDSKYVSVRELIEYVSNKTTDWTFQRRESSPGQHPQCVPPLEELGDSLNFKLANVAVNKPLPTPPAVDDGPGRKTLSDLWTNLDNLDEAAHRRSPVDSRQLTQKLLLQQERVAAGLQAATGDTAGAIEALTNDYFQTALEANPWFKQAVLPRVRGDARPDPAAQLPLPEAVLEHNFVWLNRKRKEAQQEPLSDEQMLNALKLQTWAENAHARSAGILPYVQAELDAADALRRKALDLLFTGAASGQISVDEGAFDGADAMTRAMAANDRASEAVEAMRDSHNALLDALADLPYLARFAAAMTPGSAKELLLSVQTEENSPILFPQLSLPRRSMAVETDLEAIERALEDEPRAAEIAALFAVTRELALGFDRFDTQRAIDELKQQAEPGADADETQVQRINKLGAILAKRLSDVRKDLRAEAKTLSQPKEQANAEDLANVVRYMQLPFVAASVRTQLFARRIDFESSKTQTPDGNADTTTSEAWLLRGQWQAFWALQVRSLALKDRAFREWSKLDSSAGAQEVYRQLVGIGQFLRKNPIRQQREPSDASSLTTLSVTERGKQLRGADYVSRLETEDDRSPASGSDLTVPLWSSVQRFFVAEFALHYGNRLRQDFLRDAESDSRDDWFRLAIDQARTLADGNGGRKLQEFKGLKPGDSRVVVGLKPADRLQFKRRDTSGKVALRLEDRALPDGLEGIAAAWAPLSDSGPSVQPELNGVPVVIGAKSGAALNLLAPSTSRDGCRDGSLSVDLFFRGHLASQSFEVNPCTEPDSTQVFLPRPATGAVRVGGRKERSVIFVLDWSLSMRAPIKKPKYKQAVRALRSAVEELEDDDNVGLVLFGHRVRLKEDGGILSTELNEDWFGEHPSAKLTEKDLRRVDPDNNRAAARVALDPQLLVDVQSKRTAMGSGGALRRWLDELERQNLEDEDRKSEDPQRAKLLPFGNTPLYQAIRLASRELRASDGGAIVVVSDGEPDLGPPAGLETSLKNSNAVATAIQFKFSGVLAPFVKAIPADEDSLLGKKIRKAIPPREFRLQSEVSKIGPTMRPLGTTLKNVVTGVYELGFSNTDNSDDEEEVYGSRISGLRVRGGELHDYVLRQGQFQRVRPEVLDKVQAKAANPSGAPDPTLFGHTRFVIDDEEKAGADGVGYTTATIEVALDHDNIMTPIAWPAEIEFEMRPQGEQLVSALEVSQLGGRSIPTYQLLTKKWPATRGQVQVKAWWKMKRTPVDTSVSWKALQKGPVETAAHR